MKQKNKDIKHKIINSALYLAVDQGWEYTTLRDIAEYADISAVDLCNEIESKNDVLVILGRIIDKKIVSNIEINLDDGSNARERLFDIMMDRYEALNDYRAGVCAILESFKYDPKQIVISAPHLCRSMNLMLEISGIETAGIKGALKVVGLTGVYIKVLKIWVSDESADLSKTMAALDKSLGKAEGLAKSFGF